MVNERQVLTMMSLPRVGRKTVVAALDRWNPGPMSDDEFISAISSGRLFGRPFSSEQVEAAVSEADAIIDSCVQQGIEVLSAHNPRFPARLRKIVDPPALLYLRGSSAALEGPAVAVIGTRHPSRFSETLATRLAKELVKHKVTVVSGLALGCDAAAHKGAVQAGGKTVAVLAHGLDSVHPASNRSLAHDILDSGGCLVSEYPPGTTPRPPYFVDRDRLQSGLSDAVVVVQSEIDGGSMHTVRFAKDQGRTIAAVVHPTEEGQRPPSGNAAILTQMNGVALESLKDIVALLKMSPGASVPPSGRNVSSHWGDLGRDTRRG